MPRRKTVKELDEEIKALKEKRRAAVVAESRAERKARDHALIVLGGMIESCFPDGWQSINYEEVSLFIKEHQEELRDMCCKTFKTAEATKRLRRWEQKERMAAKSSDN